MSPAKYLPVIDPVNGTRFREHPAISADEIERRIEASHDAFMTWRGVSFAERASVLTAAAERLVADKDRYAARITAEMGKPIDQSIAEIEKCSWVCRYYAEEGDKLLAEQRIPLEDAEARVIPCPMGVIYAIMPWNFPFWQAFRAAAPTLMAGNGMLLKGAPNVPGCSADVAEIITQAGAPMGLFYDLPIDVADSPAVIAHPLVRGVTLTGSEAAGSSRRIGGRGKPKKNACLSLEEATPM